MKPLHALLISVCCIITCIIGSIHVYAKETQNFSYIEMKSAEISPYYWPGNPNPIPGSEAWLQQHLYFVPTSPKARKCAQQVIGSGWNTAEGIVGGIIGATVSMISFAKSFGASSAINWFHCMYG